MAKPAFVPSQPKANLIRRVSRRGFVLVPLVVWSAAILGVWFLAGERPEPLDFQGVAVAREFQILAPADGRVELLSARENGTLEAGQLIGRLDGAALELTAQRIRSRIAEIRAEVERERALFDLDEARAQVEQDNELRRYERDVENARLNALEIVAKLEENRIRLEGLRIDLERQKELSTKNLFSEAELIRTRTEFKALGERIRQSEAVLKSRRTKLVAVEARLGDYQKRKQMPTADPDRVLGTFAWRIAAQNHDLEMLAMQRQHLEIRSPVKGLVTVLHARAGDVVEAGRPLVTLMDPDIQDVVAYLPASVAGRVKIGAKAVLQRASEPGRSIETSIARIGPAIVEVPPQAVTVPGVREWGLPVFLERSAEMETIPGETIRVRVLGLQ